jgi:hypothetical protein
MRREPTNKWASKPERKGSAHTGTHSNAMRALSRNIRANHPMCEVCEVRPSTEVHHKRKWSESVHGRLDPRNLLAVCRECHELVEKANAWQG